MTRQEVSGPGRAHARRPRLADPPPRHVAAEGQAAPAVPYRDNPAPGSASLCTCKAAGLLAGVCTACTPAWK